MVRRIPVNNKIKKSLYWFILLQPFLDFYWFYNPPLSTILPFTFPTIIRIFAVATLLGMFFSKKYHWQKIGKHWWIIAYTIVLIIYSALHIWHVKSFVSVNPNDYGYTTTGEIFYLIRMFLPIVVLYITANSNTEKKDFVRVIQSLVASISITIVLSNLFLISLMSYGNQFIQGNIFSWFSGKRMSYFLLASKGFFNFANTISAILFMLLPLMLYILVTQFNLINVILYIFQSLAMLELCTKVAAYGLIISSAIFVFLYLIHHFVFKNIKINNYAISIIVLGTLATGLIFPFSPAIQRGNFEEKITELRSNKKNHIKSHKQVDVSQTLKEGLKKHSGKKREKFLKNFFAKYSDFYSLNSRFVKQSYSYKYDPEFWLEIIKLPVQDRMNNRLIEQKMLNQVLKTNNNKLDKWLGISYVRETNIFNLERDFIAQTYSLGLIGMIIFVGIYLVILIYAGFKWIINSQNRSFLNSCLLTSSSFLIFSSYYSGNVMDFLTATLILSFIMGYLLKSLNTTKKAA
ncbi:O-antigen ligase family protein [Lactobacillus mulieris]|nr:O-antigen ligase family protein [Lactobacillus mulieris]MCF1847183.1 O-antigen ligase family protein [Lactobacillus mulieris]